MQRRIRVGLIGRVPACYLSGESFCFTFRCRKGTRALMISGVVVVHMDMITSIHGGCHVALISVHFNALRRIWTIEEAIYAFAPLKPMSLPSFI